MTWTTASPSGATVPVVGALMVLTLIALVYALGLLRRVLQMRRPGWVPAEGLDMDREEDEP